MGTFLWITMPKIFLSLWLLVVVVAALWQRMGMYDKKTYWFIFLKASEIGAILAAMELSSRWYWVARATSENILASVGIAFVGAAISVVIYFVFCFLLVLIYVLLKRVYHFSLSGPVEKTKAWYGRRIANNWRRADDIVKRGFWKSIFD